MIDLPFGQLAFLNPIILTGLLALPALWFLLRVFPPVPKLVRLPGAWLIEGLIPAEQTTSKTPWWIILLRSIVAALIIIALAQPVINPAQSLNIQGHVRIVMDNSWASAQTWNAQQQAATEIVDRAARDKIQIHILTTAPEAGHKDVTALGPMTSNDARSVLRGMKPNPWPADYAAARSQILGNRNKDGIHTFWIGTGIDEGRGTELAAALQSQGGLTYMEPDASSRPLLLRPHRQEGNNLGLYAHATKGVPDNMPLTIDLVGHDGQIIDQAKISMATSGDPVPIEFKLPDALRGQARMARIAGRSSAGSTVVFDDISGKKTVGITSTKQSGGGTPLIDSSYYIARALESTADLHSDSIDKLLEIKGLSVIILPDVGTLPPATLQSLETWIRKGGLLLRFAGPNMSEGDSFLTPTPIRRGERALSGNMSWDSKSSAIIDLPPTSPLYGLNIPRDIQVYQQILSEPVSDLEKKTWMMLDDGTPLVTASSLDKGLIVLVHTTATPEWSNFALSGLYVKFLEKIISFGGTSSPLSDAAGMLHPISVMDGAGYLSQPGPTVMPIPAEKFNEQGIDSSHPPGIYGRSGLRKNMNIGDKTPSINAMPGLPVGVERTSFAGRQETKLMPLVLALSMTLFLIDWLIILIIQGIGTGSLRLALRSSLRASSATILFLAVLIGGTPAQAQDETSIRHAGSIYLAYVETGSVGIDRLIYKGLENLSNVLRERTSAEPGGITGVDPETDELSFYPLIYWVITPQTEPLSQNALLNIQNYLNNGGTILFDTRDGGDGFAQDGLALSPSALNLQKITYGLDIPPLTVTPDNHVIKRSFYLLSGFYGSYETGSLWVEEQSAIGRDGVSSVMVGGNDWASAWAGSSVGEGTRQQEMSFRFGVNLMMYALTGNYKADQVHIPHILERLGR